MRPCILAVVAGLAWSGPAAAEDMPRYDPDGYCDTVAETVGGSASIKNGCIRMEQMAYDALKAKWSDLPAKVTAYCDDVAGTVGGSYSILKGCVEMEMKAAGNAETFKF